MNILGRPVSIRIGVAWEWALPAAQLLLLHHWIEGSIDEWHWAFVFAPALWNLSIIAFFMARATLLFAMEDLNSWMKRRAYRKSRGLQ